MAVEPLDRTDAGLHRVPLAFPSLLSLKDTVGEAPRSWIQVATVGEFVSAKYGPFVIADSDLAQMLHNFTHVTPVAPTRIPVDWDHLSMNPRQPGDGAAAGWFTALELRQKGRELWGDIEWTPRGAEAIRNREYQFVSPSFVKDYTTPEGKKIGTTLLAAAITNHPFLQGMAALTLYNFAVLGDLALAQPDAMAVNLADLGQRVTFVEDAEKTPELTTADERAGTYIVKAAIGDGEDQFVRLTTPDGQEFGWFRVEQLKPARAASANPMPPKDQTRQEEPTMSANTHEQATDQELVTLANTIAREHPGMSLRDATIQAGMQRPDLATARRKDIGVEEEAENQPRPVVIHNLHRKPEEGFAELCTRVALERQIDLRSAVRMVSESFPQLAERYASGEF